jgi:flagellar biosynthetic protein FliQ
MMSEAQFYDTMRSGLWTALIVSGPILTVALVTGLTIGLFQALTSIQEMTLTFVPKLAAIVATFWMSMGFMSEALISHFQSSIIPIIAGAP